MPPGSTTRRGVVGRGRGLPSAVLWSAPVRRRRASGRTPAHTPHHPILPLHCRRRGRGRWAAHAVPVRRWGAMAIFRVISRGAPLGGRVVIMVVPGAVWVEAGQRAALPGSWWRRTGGGVGRWTVAVVPLGRGVSAVGEGLQGGLWPGLTAREFLERVAVIVGPPGMRGGRVGAPGGVGRPARTQQEFH